MKRFFIIMGLLFLLYFLAIAFFIPHGTSFYLIWLLAAIAAFIASFLSGRGKYLLNRLPKWIRKVMILLIITGLAIFIFIEACIISQFWSKVPEDLDYVIVLGAQMKTSGPSRVLQMRLDAAYEYLARNEGTKAILSGGQGPDEPVSEAQGMYEYLTARGIAAGRLILEDKSTSTWENLIFSEKYFDKKHDTAGVITNNFHVFRAKKIAETAGYAHVYGLAANSEVALHVNNMTREFFGVVKDFLVGNLKIFTSKGGYYEHD